MWGRRRDHPRSRGVYGTLMICACICCGSSPLARGLPHNPIPGILRDRIIPARAGFTAQDPQEPQRSPDHPRSRGVYQRVFPSLPRQEGSSPLARGLHAVQEEPGHREGIIPARAGFTLEDTANALLESDHPRSRGVYAVSAATTWLYHGSSPLARGLRVSAGPPDQQPRIIPARAGFTRRRWGRGRRTGDHPRSRGVYPRRCGPSTRCTGSSPLARGLPGPGGAGGWRTGIIPARAGFTLWTPWKRPEGGDHPRSRGVYRGTAAPSETRGGSSPLARGLPTPRAAGQRGVRIIPARAGFTRRSSIR